MSGLFGGAQAATTHATQAMGIDFQGAQYGNVVPVVYGQNKVSANCIWYGDFQSHAQQQKAGKGGGGNTASYTYSASAQMGICEGPGVSLVTVYDGTSIVDLSSINYAFASGAKGQAPWSHLSGSYALGYSLTAVFSFQNLALGSSATLPNYNYEVKALKPYSSNIPDANPRDIVQDLCSDPYHGINFPWLGNLTHYSNYCVANSLFLSPVYDQQQTAQQTLSDLFKYTNAYAYYSDDQLKVVPLGDVAVTGNGVTYTPNVTSLVDLDGSDFLVNGQGDIPVELDRIAPQDALNIVRVEFTDRSNTYHDSAIVAAIDFDVVANGERSDTSETVNGCTTADVARFIGQNLVQRVFYVRNTYTFKLPWNYCYLEPTDIVTLTDTSLGLIKAPVRITSIEEDGGSVLTVEAEEFPEGVGHSSAYGTQPNGGTNPDQNSDPGPVNAPYLFRGPGFLVNGSSPEIWCAVNGSNSMWAACEVYLSHDGSSYTYCGTIAGQARYGELNTALPAGTADPDTTNTPTVQLYAPAQILGGSQTDADNFVTLAMIDTEVIAYETATLEGANQYQLSYLRRGGYGSANVAHAVGAPFVRLDDSIFRMPVDPSLIGSTVYLKFLSINSFGRTPRTLAEETAYTYVVDTNVELPDVPDVPANFAAQAVADGVALTWINNNPAAVGCTSIEYATADGGPFTVLAQVGPTTTAFHHSFTNGSTYYYRARSRGPLVQSGWSAYTATLSSAGVNITGTGGATTTLTQIQTDVTDLQDTAAQLTTTTQTNAANLSQEVTDRETAITQEATDRENADTAEASARVQAIKQAIATATWNSTTAYTQGQYVTDGTNLYQAALDVPAGTALTNTTYWTKIGTYSTAGGATAFAVSQSSTNATNLSSEVNQRTLLATQLVGGYTGTDLNGVTSGLVAAERDARVTQGQSMASQMALLSAGVGEQFDYAVIWYFETSVEGWTDSSGAAAVASAPSWIYAANAFLVSPANLGINAAEFQQMRFRVRKNGSPTWQGKIGAELGSASTWTYLTVNVPEPDWDANGIGVAIVDVSQWTGTVNQLELVFPTSASTTNFYDLDWVAIGRPAPGASQAAVSQAETVAATANTAEVTARQQLAVSLTGTTDASSVKSGLLYNEQTARQTADTTQLSQINAMQARMPSGTGQLATADALNTTNANVSTNAGNITSNSSELASISNTINDPTNGLASKASQTALNSLSGTVTQQGNAQTATNQSVTALQTSVGGLQQSRPTAMFAMDSLPAVVGSGGGTFALVAGAGTTGPNVLRCTGPVAWDMRASPSSQPPIFAYDPAKLYRLRIGFKSNNSTAIVTCGITPLNASGADVMGGSGEWYVVKNGTANSTNYTVLEGWFTGNTGAASQPAASTQAAPANMPAGTASFALEFLINWGQSTGYVTDVDFVSLDVYDNTSIQKTYANATAIGTLQTTTQQQGNTLTSQGQSITALQSTVNDPNSGVAATASGLNTLTGIVTSNGQLISANSTAINGVSASLNAITPGAKNSFVLDMASLPLGMTGPLVTGQANYVGGTAVRCTNYASINAPAAYNFSYDPTLLYRVRVAVQVITDATSGSQQSLYAGLSARKADGTAAATNNGSCYFVASARAPKVADGYKVYEGWVTGASGSGNTSGDGATALNPMALPTGTRIVTPVLLVNYNGASSGQVTDVDYFRIDVFDASQAAQLAATQASVTNESNARVQGDAANAANITANANEINAVSVRMPSGTGTVATQASVDAVSTTASNAASAASAAQSSANSALTQIQATYTLSLDVNGKVVGYVAQNNGTVGTLTFNFDDVNFTNGAGTSTIEGGIIVQSAGSFMKVAGPAFGANSDLVEWFGPQMAVTACTKANATYYLGTDGSAYFGGSLSAGTLKNAATSTQISGTASVQTGIFGTNGGAKTVVLSLTCHNSGTETNNPGNVNSSATVLLQRSYAGGAWTTIGTLNATGTVTSTYDAENKVYDVNATLGGSITVTDNQAGTGTFNYQAVMSNAVEWPIQIGANYGTQSLSIVSTEQ